MEKEYADLLKKFQCDYNRNAEERFAQTLSENEMVRLFFVNENEAFTDGKNIIVDPATDELFADRKALDDTSVFLKLPKVVLVDTWNVLHIVTRAQTIHECLHILYTDFPGRYSTDPKCDSHNKKMVMGMISNIVEDAYIEAVGCSYFDNMEFYLKFGRISRLFSNHPSKGTVERRFGEMAQAEREALRKEVREGKIREEPVRTGSEILMDFLDYMATILLYPMIKQKEPATDMAEYVEKSKQLFLDGSVAPSPKERYAYVSRIFDLIEHLIPEDDGEEELHFERLLAILGGGKTHSADGSTIGGEAHHGKPQKVTIRLFTNLDGTPRENEPPIDQLMQLIRTLARDKEIALSIVEYPGSFTVISGGAYDCSVIHKDIIINENHPKINMNLRKAYQNIYNRYKINIRSYNSRFVQLLKARVNCREEKHLYGSGVTSNRLGDPKKRYWYRQVQGEDLPDMAVMLLIDGSGSMSGERQIAAMHSAVILHEVLKKQEISHAIVEHRSWGQAPEMDVNILVRFQGHDEEKYNLMQLDANGDNRDGLALFWAERYMTQNTFNEYRLIIVLSDGYPAHAADDYYPPVSTMDTANAVKKITGRGTHIIGVSLDSPGEFDTYEQLSKIYPHLVGCNDLNRLTGQLLGIVAKLL